MPSYVLIVDFFSLVLAVVGFNMAFRQATVRRYFRRSIHPPAQASEQDAHQDPVAYILRISGVMIMIFGIVIGGMVTLLNLA